jgi:hypothetical protein
MRSRDADPSHPPPDALRARAPFRGFVRTSRYLAMRDGTRLAIDVCLPRGLGAGARVPTIVRSTRYFRRFQLANGLRGRLPEAVVDPLNAPLRALFTAHGYAWVDVDARGSGASFGFRPCPWWIDGEVKDGAELVDWIVAQPWSNGRVGSTGVSYDGTTAEFLAQTRHPAVRAVAPRFSLFDTYADIAFPGGVHLAWFTEKWAAANAALDRNEPQGFIGTVLGLRATGAEDPRVAVPGTLPHALVSAFGAPPVQRALGAFLGAALAGVARVDDDPDGRTLREAIASHANNYSVHEGALRVTFREDHPPSSPLPEGAVDTFSPHTYLDDLRASGTAFLSQSGWFDGAYANAAIKRHRALTAGSDAPHELSIGPWIHGGMFDLDPDAPAREAAFDHGAELLGFFDAHLRERTADTDARPPRPRARYFLMGEGRWKGADEFPPRGVRTRVAHLGEDGALRDEAAGATSGLDELIVDPRAGVGRRTRWETLLSPLVHADGPRVPKGALAYVGARLDRDLEITGSPVLVLRLAAWPADASVFAYLSVITPEGTERTPTEGCLRTLHGTRLDEASPFPRVIASFRREDARALSEGEFATHAIELQPTALLVRAGSRLKLSITGADVDHFRGPIAKRLRVDRAGSRLLLPYLPR